MEPAYGRAEQATADEARAQLLGRIERWPITSYHLKIRGFVGIANMFDGLDAMVIAFVLPVLGQLWHLTPGQMGLLISSGFLGQVVGATGFGRMAERYGRIPVLILTTAIFSLASACSVFAAGFTFFFVIRAIQGLGLGAEIPVASAYVNEIAPAKTRGQFVLLFEYAFTVGLFLCGFLGRWIVPNLGWKAMFLITGLPSLLVLPGMYWSPESPRWLIHKGRTADAEKVISHIEDKIRATGRTLPPPEEFVFPAPVIPSRWSEFFSKEYGLRSAVVWVLWLAIGFVQWPLIAFLPSIFNRVYHVPLAESLNFALYYNCAQVVGRLCAVFLIDRTGRKKWFICGFLITAVTFIVMGATGMKTAMQVFWLALIAIVAMGTLNMSVWLYSCELFPTRMRSTGTGIGFAVGKIAGMIAPPVMGWGIATGGLAKVFIFLAVLPVVAALFLILFAVETKKRVLEDVSP